LIHKRSLLQSIWNFKAVSRVKATWRCCWQQAVAYLATRTEI